MPLRDAYCDIYALSFLCINYFIEYHSYNLSVTYGVAFNRNLYKSKVFNQDMGKGEYNQTWNYVIAIVCIFAIVLTTYLVLFKTGPAASGLGDNAGQVYGVAGPTNAINKQLTEAGATVELKRFIDVKPDGYAYLDEKEETIE